MRSRVQAGVVCCLIAVLAHSQEQTTTKTTTAPIEQVLVETYHVQQGTNGRPELTTYRIYLDLAPMHSLQVIYGDEQHTLRIETTGAFYNTDKGSVVYGDRLIVDPKSFEALAMDSWLTIGMIGADHVGVPLELDGDGSILECPATDPVSGIQHRGLRDPLCVKDGLALAPEPRELVTWRLDQGYLGAVQGGTILSNDAAWGMLGGMKGATEENIVLVAQITTADPLHFTLNAQIGLPDGNYVRVVWNDPKEGELLMEQLKYGEKHVN